MKKGLTYLIYILLLTASLSLAQTPSVNEQAADTTEVTVDVLFGLWNNNLTPEFEEALKKHAEILIENPEVTSIIEGYSDSTGDPDTNIELSKQRAEAVKFYLVGLGVTPEKISIEAKGGTDIFAKGDNPEALSANRRARLLYEFAIVEEEIQAVDETTITVEESSEENTDADITLAKSPPPTPGPAPPPTPGPPPPPTPPPSLLNTIGDEVIDKAPGNVVFESPKEMQLEGTYLVQVTVKSDFTEELNQSAAQASGLGDLNLSDDMLVILTGRGFNIQPVEDRFNSKELFPDDHGAQLDSISPKGDVKWQWYVTPLKEGFQTLNLSLFIDIEEPEFSQVNTEYKIFKRIVDVREGFLRSILSSYWLSAIVVLIIIAVLSFLILDRYNSL